MHRPSLAWLIAYTLLGCTLNSPAPSPRATDVPILRPSVPHVAVAPRTLHAANLTFIESVTGGADAEATLPLIVVLHGYGDSPEGIVGLYTGLTIPARVVAFRGSSAAGPGFAWFAPGADRAEGIRLAADAVAAAMIDIMRQRPTCGLPVVSGFSQGAMVAYALAARSPSIVRAAAPIAGMLPEALRPLPSALGGVRPEVQAFHGEADPRVPVSDARRTIAWMREAGLTANLTTESGIEHTVTPNIRAGLYTFLTRVARCNSPTR